MRSSTTMALRRYAPLGHCMYCLAAGVKLTEEHLIPRSLGGRLTLRDSVCEPCRALTGQPERATLEREFIVPKTLLALKRRRARKKGPRHLPAVALGGGQDRCAAGVSLRPEEFPRSFALPVFDAAGLLAGTDRSTACQPVEFVHCRLQVGSAHVENSACAAPLADPTAFAYSLAKWAYSYAVAERACDDCDTGDIRRLLAGARRDAFNFVGSACGRERVGDATLLHDLRIRRVGTHLTVLLRVLGSAGMQPYEVVIGPLRRQAGQRPAWE